MREKRKLYYEKVEQYFPEDIYLKRDKNSQTIRELDAKEKKTMKQVKIDVHRTIPEVEIFGHDLV